MSEKCSSVKPPISLNQGSDSSKGVPFILSQSGDMQPKIVDHLLTDSDQPLSLGLAQQLKQLPDSGGCGDHQHLHQFAPREQPRGIDQLVVFVEPRPHQTAHTSQERSPALPDRRLAVQKGALRSVWSGARCGTVTPHSSTSKKRSGWTIFGTPLTVSESRQGEEPKTRRHHMGRFPVEMAA